MLAPSFLLESQPAPSGSSGTKYFRLRNCSHEGNQSNSSLSIFCEKVCGFTACILSHPANGCEPMVSLLEREKVRNAQEGH